MTALKVDFAIDELEDLFGKTADDLQSDVAINGRSIGGTLKYVSGGWDPGTWSEEEAVGNFLVMHAEVPDVDDVTITVKLTNPQVLDSDGLIVLKIRDKDTQTIHVTASKDGLTSVTKEYNLKGLTLEESA